MRVQIPSLAPDINAGVAQLEEQYFRKVEVIDSTSVTSSKKRTIRMEIAEKLINATDFYTILDISGEEVVCFRSVKDQYIKTLVFSDLTKVWDYEAAIIYRHRYPIYVLCQFYHGYVSNEGTSLKTDKKGKDLYKYIQSMGELLEKLFLARIDNGVLTLNYMIR